jgi:Grx4 family monothiol glutaredoxin
VIVIDRRSILNRSSMADFASGEVVNIDDVSDFVALKASGRSSVLMFWADWHEPSQEGGQMHGVFMILKGKYPGLTFCLVNAEEVPDVGLELKVSVVPTIVCIRGETVLGTVEGANPPEVTKMVKKFNELPKPVAVDPVAVLNKRLYALVSAQPVMLFMKGTPEAPRCGFSRKIVDLLNEQKVPFASFDILSDEDVRQGLKTLFDWPTFPQLYLRGELLGGLDIITEMAAEGSEGGLMEQFQLGPIGGVVEPLEDRLKKLVNEKQFMLFMKGNPDEPKCGFSRTIVEILTTGGVVFGHFDILQDEEVRQGLKTYSDWPTYPQVYVNGVLIGGLDIIQETVAELEDGVSVTEALLKAAQE